VFGPAEADGGLLDTDTFEEGQYWIVEATVPAGFEGSDPILIELNVDPSVTCIWDADGLDECLPNGEEQSELAFTIVIVSNSPTDPEPTPTGTVGGATGTPRVTAEPTLPATDTAGVAGSTGEAWRLVLLGLAGVLGAALALHPARVRRDDEAR
jgi:hypothetical protein